MSEDSGEILDIADKTIFEVEQASASRNQLIRARTEISEIVDKPLVPACEAFYDLNIQTLSSSASKENFQEEGDTANIIIDYGSLSEANRRIVDQMIADGVGQMLGEYDSWVAVRFGFPIDRTTTVRQIENLSLDLASRFKKQKMTWAPTYTQKQIAGFYASPEVEQMGPAEVSEQTGYFYSPEDGLFYESEEHYNKAHEEVE